MWGILVHSSLATHSQTCISSRTYNHNHKFIHAETDRQETTEHYETRPTLCENASISQGIGRGRSMDAAELLFS